MAVRPSMLALIARVRLLINDPNPPATNFSDQQIEDVMDEFSRADMQSMVLRAKPTFVTGTIQYLDYYSDLENWEDDYVLKQYLVNIVTPSLAEVIPGHWQFAVTTLPPVYISGKTYDVYRAAADLLERLCSQWMLSYNLTVDGQTLHREGAIANIEKRIAQLRKKQRPTVSSMLRSDIALDPTVINVSLGPTAIDYMASGNGR